LVIREWNEKRIKFQVMIQKKTEDSGKQRNEENYRKPRFCDDDDGSI